MKSVQGKVILVTGSSRGIGKATAFELAKQGARVVINGKNSDRLQKTKEEFDSQGLSSLAIAADVTSIDECQSMIDQIISNYGQLDGLIANAGLTMESNFEDTDPKAFKLVFDSHLYGSIYPVKVSLSHLEKVGGSVVFISSLAGLYGMPRFSAYCSGKMALTAFWQSMRFEKRRSGIHFGLMHICFVKNDAEKTLIDLNGKTTLMPPRPTRIQQPQEKIARKIINMMKYRRNRQVISAYGKLYAFIARYCRPLMNFFLNNYFKT